MSLATAAIAANRFGLGARADELRTIAGDPRGWLLEQLDPQQRDPTPLSELPATGEALLVFPSYLLRRGVAARLDRRPQAPATPSPDGSAGRSAEADGAGDAAQALQTTLRELIRESTREATEARLAAAIASATPFRERLVWFWSNHFALSGSKPPVTLLAPAFERDAIRPHVTGRFVDMLSAATRHPAMQLSLDNYRNLGPHSWYAQHPEDYAGGLFPQTNAKIGLNENHARELLELHTVGVDAGYDQADVIGLARILTGWGIRPAFAARSDRRRLLRQVFSATDPLAAVEDEIDALTRDYARRPWQELFLFDERAHEPGPVTVMGRQYEDDGEQQGQRVLNDLARHPAASRFLATKLCRHFIADEPPAAAVDRVAQACRDSEGDLAAMARALVTCPQAWEPSRRKFKRPDEYLVSTLRALTDRPDNLTPFVGALIDMGQPPFRPPGPDGWPDSEEHWASPDGVWKRIEWVDTLARRVGFAGLDAATLGRTLLGGGLSQATMRAIEGASSPAQALVLLLVSPEFMRR